MNMNTDRATPAVRRLAARYGVTLAAVEGTGAGGRITTDDVTRVAQAADAGIYAALFGTASPRRADPDDELYSVLFGTE